MELGIKIMKETRVKTIFYNTLSIYDHKLNLLNDYKKVKLVPFGEFLPFEEILK